MGIIKRIASGRSNIKAEQKFIDEVNDPSGSKKRKQKRESASSGRNPTGTLGAGTPQTTRSKVLGV